MCLAGLAGVAAVRGAAREAAQLAVAVESILNEINGHLDPADQAPFEANVARAGAQLGEKMFVAEQAQARTLLAQQDSASTLARMIELAMGI